MSQAIRVQLLIAFIILSSAILAQANVSQIEAKRFDSTRHDEVELIGPYLILTTDYGANHRQRSSFFYSIQWTYVGLT